MQRVSMSAGLADPVSFTCVHASSTKEVIRVKAIRRAMPR